MQLPHRCSGRVQTLSSVSPNNVNNNFNVTVAGSPAASTRSSSTGRVQRRRSSVSTLVAAGSGGAAVTVLQTNTNDTDIQFINVSGSTAASSCWPSTE